MLSGPSIPLNNADPYITRKLRPVKKPLPVAALNLAVAALAAAALAAFAAGCSRPGDLLNEGAPATPTLSVEETATLVLEALKQGDTDTFLEHTDLWGIYKRFPAPMRKAFSFEQFDAAVRRAARKVRNDAMAELSYEILGVEDRGDLKLVTLKTRSAPGKKWKTYQAWFGIVDGVWKITADGVRQLPTD